MIQDRSPHHPHHVTDGNRSTDIRAFSKFDDEQFDTIAVYFCENPDNTFSNA